jgi:hypothetical protein
MGEKAATRSIEVRVDRLSQLFDTLDIMGGSMPMPRIDYFIYF